MLYYHTLIQIKECKVHSLQPHGFVHNFMKIHTKLRITIFSYVLYTEASRGMVHGVRSRRAGTGPMDNAYPAKHA